MEVNPRRNGRNPQEYHLGAQNHSKYERKSESCAQEKATCAGNALNLYVAPSFFLKPLQFLCSTFNLSLLKPLHYLLTAKRKNITWVR
jgi:hypothetical protein